MAAPEKTEALPAAAPKAGGASGWIPLIVSIVVMPALAYVLTNYVLLPRLQQAIGTQTAHAREGTTEGATGTSEKSKESKPKNKVALTKIVVNVSGSLGTRLLLASVTLAGDAGDFKSKIEENMDQLRDLAAGTLGSKTIADLEKPEARNLIRAELLSQFNVALGANTVQEIYITEFAIQ